jgi:hypothetical protein
VKWHGLKLAYEEDAERIRGTLPMPSRTVVIGGSTLQPIIGSVAPKSHIDVVFTCSLISSTHTIEANGPAPEGRSSPKGLLENDLKSVSNPDRIWRCDEIVLASWRCRDRRRSCIGSRARCC